MSIHTLTEGHNVENWIKSPLFEATGAVFGDIDHIIRIGSDYMIRGWLLDWKPNSLRITVAMEHRAARPLIRADLREDVRDAFPSHPAALYAGKVFVLEGVAVDDSSPPLKWRIAEKDAPYRYVPISPRTAVPAARILERGILT